MITSAKNLIGYRIETETGDAGKVKDLYFKDDVWAVRYFIAGTRRFLPSRRVLLNPLEIEELDLFERRLRVSKTRKDLRGGFRAGRLRTVSQEKELEIVAMSGAGTSLLPFAHWGAGGLAGPRLPGRRFPSRGRRGRRNRMRSVKRLVGYAVHGRSGRIGTLEDFLLEDIYWMLRYLVVKTADHRRILIIADRVEDLSWEERSIEVGLDEEETEEAPIYEPSALAEANLGETKTPLRDAPGIR